MTKPTTPAYDAVIIGGGHNGLIASFYLARSGLKTLVLEAKPFVGGCCVTEELIPGFRFSTCANVLWSLRPKIVSELRLIERGLKVDSRQFLRLLPDGRYMFSCRFGGVAPGESLAHLLGEIAKFSPADAKNFPRYQAFTGRLSRIFGPWLLANPPRIEDLYARCADAEDRAALDRALGQSVAQIMDHFFSSEEMRDSGIVADFGDVTDRGTGLLYGLTEALGSYSENGQPVLNGFVRGGMGVVTGLMRQAAEEAGALVRTGAKVAKLLVEGRRVVGVELEGGERIAAKRVVSNVDIKQTFHRLLSRDAIPAGLEARVLALESGRAGGLKIHCALSEMLDYRLSDDRLSAEERRRATLILAPNRAYRQAAWQAAARGDLPDAPLLAGFLPSVYDPTLAPAGKYCWSAFGIWVPVKPKGGTWKERKHELAENIFRVMDRHTTNFRKALIDYVIFTPDDLEASNGLTDGNIHHIDGTPDQLLWKRPLEEMARYATPVPGLYLCGSSCHPWGEVNGGPGYNAAHAILAERSSAKA